MSHLSHEALWALARGEAEAAQAETLRAHLETCETCRQAHDDVCAAQAVLAVLPEAPPMPEAVARRVGVALSEEIDRRAARRFTSWWQQLFGPRWVLAAALGVLVAVVGAFLAARPAADSTPVAEPAVTPAPTPTPPLTPPPPSAAPVAAPKLTAKVATAKKASAASKPAAKAQELAEGTVVKTDRGGSLWMHLPDGSRAGLTSASEVTLATLEKDKLTLDVAVGSLALVVPHRADRVLTVRAGDLEVEDLGTRFLVSREVGRVLVAVEEGSVQVKTPTSVETVTAGRAVTWRDGRLESLAWDVKPRTPEPAQPTSIAKLSKDDDEEEEPPAEVAEAQASEPAAPGAPTAPQDSASPATGEDEWATPPPSSLQPPAPPPSVETAHPAPIVLPAPAPTPRTPPRHRGFNLGELERRLRQFTRDLQRPFKELEGHVRAQQATDVARLADAGDCEGSLRLADTWLRYTNRMGEERELRRGVLRQKLRCLRHLGRHAEAETVEREIDGL